MKKILSNIPLTSALISGWQLASKGYINYERSYIRKQQWKIFFHVVLNPAFAHKWFAFLKSPDFEYVSINRPRLYIKPFRPYISIKWSRSQKLKVILDTYRFIKSKGDTFGQTLIHKEGIVLANLVFDNMHEGFLKLGYDDRFRKEGELVLWFECSQLGGKIVSVAFSLEESVEGHWLCRIGCVQAHNVVSTPTTSEANNDVDTLASYKATQKLLHGLRPHAFIIHSVQELSRHLGCTAIYCTGNSIQAYNKAHAIHLPWRHSINFDYDKFWSEVGGQDIGKGWFELTLKPVHKDIQEIKSHKRSMYRKRFEMLDNLSAQIANTVNALQDTKGLPGHVYVMAAAVEVINILQPM